MAALARVLRTPVLEYIMAQKVSADANATQDEPVSFPPFTRAASTLVEGENLVRNVTVRYDGFNLEQMSELASRPVIIKWQASFKKHGPSRYPAQEPVVIVATLGARGYVDAETQAIASLDSMTDEEREKIFARYTQPKA